MLAKAIGAEFREVVERDHEGRPARVVIATRTYPTTPDDLWEALTSAERIPRWFLPIEGDLKLHGRYQLKGNAGGTITRCDPPKALDITWEFNGGLGWVTVRLAPDGDGTKLTLEHIVHSADVEEFWKQFGPGAVGVGWDISLESLGLHIASGGGKVELEGDTGWSATEEGKVATRASARAWAEAHIAGGEASDIAHGMADRTAAFYTGG